MAERAYILTQDIGVFSCKAVLFSSDGSIVRSNIVSYLPQYNDQDWSWQSPQLWWEAFCLNCRTVLADIPPADVKVVALCGQMMACLPVDHRVRPLYDCITWDDKRAVEQVKDINSAVGAETIHRITGSCLGYSFSLPKILWLKKHHPDIYQATYRFVQCKDYINYLLTGQLVTDETDAGFTQMYDLFGRCWSDDILQATGIDRTKLPEVVPFGTILGHVTKQAAEQCGLDTSTLVVQGLGDGRAPSVGSGIQEPGEGCLYLGSTAWLSQATASRTMDIDHAITKASFLRPDLYVNGGSILSGRLCADWYVKAFFPQYDGRDLSSFLAGQLPNSPVGSKGLLFMPYLRGERAPWWNNYAKGGFVGLCSHHNQYDFCRSIIEGVSFQLGIIKHRIENIEPFTSMRLTGSGCSPQWQQVLSDVLEMDIVSSDAANHVACVGAAAVAGVATGLLQDYSDVSRFHHNQRITTPIEANTEIYQELLPAFEDCYYALQDINEHLSQVNQSKLNLYDRN